jgi:hypothetical protein
MLIAISESRRPRRNSVRYLVNAGLKVLLDDSEGLAGGLIDRAGSNSRAILNSTQDALAKLPKVSGASAGQIYLAPETARALTAAEQAESRLRFVQTGYTPQHRLSRIHV